MTKRARSSPNERAHRRPVRVPTEVSTPGIDRCAPAHSRSVGERIASWVSPRRSPGLQSHKLIVAAHGGKPLSAATLPAERALTRPKLRRSERQRCDRCSCALPIRSAEAQNDIGPFRLLLAERPDVSARRGESHPHSESAWNDRGATEQQAHARILVGSDLLAGLAARDHALRVLGVVVVPTARDTVRVRADAQQRLVVVFD